MQHQAFSARRHAQRAEYIHVEIELRETLEQIIHFCVPETATREGFDLEVMPMPPTRPLLKIM